MATKPKSTPTPQALPNLPHEGDVVRTRPRPGGPRIPENGKPGAFWPDVWKRRRFDAFVRGLFHDGDIEISADADDAPAMFCDGPGGPVLQSTPVPVTNDQRPSTEGDPR